MNCRRDAEVSQICFKEDTRISHLAGNFAPNNFLKVTHLLNMN